MGGERILKPASFLIYGICVGTFPLIPYSIMNPAQDAGVAMLLNVICGFFLLVFYRSLLHLGKEGEGLYAIIDSAFGRIISKVILGIYALFVVLMTCKDFSTFWGTIGTITLTKQTPQFIIALIIVPIFLICVQGGIRTIIQISVFYSTICLLSNIVILIICVGNIQFDHFLPLFYDGVRPTFREFFKLSSNSAGELLLLLFIPQICAELKPRIKWYLIPFTCILITGLIKYVVNVGLMGEYLNYVTIPTTSSVSALTINNVQLRIEPLVIIAWYATGIVKLSVEYTILTNITSKVLGNVTAKAFLLPIGLSVWSLTLLLFQRHIEVVSFPGTYVVYSFIFALFFPLMLWLYLKVRRRLLHEV